MTKEKSLLSPQKEKDDEQNMSLFMKLLEELLALFGLSFGKGGVPLDDKFISSPENRKMVKDKAIEMLNHPLGKAVLNLGLKIPGVRNMIKSHLEANPELAELAKEIISKNPSLQNKLSGYEEFSRLVPDSARTQMSNTPPAFTDIRPEIAELRRIDNPKVQSILNEHEANSQTVPLSSMPNSVLQAPPVPSMLPGSEVLQQVRQGSTNKDEENQTQERNPGNEL